MDAENWNFITVEEALAAWTLVKGWFGEQKVGSPYALLMSRNPGPVYTPPPMHDQWMMNVGVENGGTGVAHSLGLVWYYWKKYCEQYRNPEVATKELKKAMGV